MYYLILTFVIAGIGAIIGVKLKIPAGGMIGAMALVVVFNILSGNAHMPQGVRQVTQVAAGALVGIRISRKDIYELKDIIIPAAILVFGMIVLNFSFGFLIAGVSELDLVTSLFATAPGGLSDMALIADELGADSPKVAILQLLRLISVISIFPIFIKRICHASAEKKEGEQENCGRPADEIVVEEPLSKEPVLQKLILQEAGGAALRPEEVGIQEAKVSELNGASPEVQEVEQSQVESRKESASGETGMKAGPKIFGRSISRNHINLGFTFCIAAIGGITGILLKIPAGAMIVSMLAVVVFNLSTGRGYFPDKLRVITQMATGALIGSRMTREDLLSLNDIIIPAAVMVVGMIILNLIIGYTISRLTKLNLPTALLASTPGGLQEMALMAEDLGADAPKVAVLQLMRLITVISVFPGMLEFVSKFFS